MNCLEAWVLLCGVTLSMSSPPGSLGFSFPVSKWGFGAVLSSLGVTELPEQPHMAKLIRNMLVYGQRQFISLSFPTSNSKVCPLQLYSPEQGTLGCWGPQVSVDPVTPCCPSRDPVRAVAHIPRYLGLPCPILPRPKTKSLIRYREEGPLAAAGYVALFTDSALAEDGRKEHLGPGWA